jgi:GTP diphosphokinase / guanosine-3',5'-bis(diphosphate) 3'-diphosphatase
MGDLLTRRGWKRVALKTALPHNGGVRQYELIEKVKGYNPKADIGLINRAYVYSMKAHGGQQRASGEPYLMHPLAVAGILADLQLDDASICVGLLHDTLEDTLATYDELRQLFGPEVAELVEGVTKLSKISFEDKTVEQAENFRKLLLAMSKDIRVLLIKLADRLHNMRTLNAKKAESQRKTAKETLDIYVPLADRIGVHGVKAELEDLAFRILEPDEYAHLERQMAEWRAQDDLVGRVLEELKAKLAEAGIGAEVSGREKSIASIYQKMVRKSLAFDQLTDIVAYRILVAEKAACYAALGLLHDQYKAIPGRFKDYISAPKPNGYQSLHTSVVGPFNNRMEVQIRTQDMHDVAENGVAAHWVYNHIKAPEKGDGLGKETAAQVAATKAKGRGTLLTPEAEKQPATNPYRWLKGLVEQLQGMEDPAEFYENARMELFAEHVFAMTPKGDVIQLPSGATPLDFAYAVHTKVGNHAVSAKVNGSVVPLRRQLENGDVVEIVTNPNQHPNPGWRELVVSSRARTQINRYLRQQEREEQVRLGREILEKAARRDGWRWDIKELGQLVKKLPVGQITETDDIFAALGQGRLFPRQIYEALYPAAPALTPDQIAQKQLDAGKKNPKLHEGATGPATALEGVMAGMSIHYAKCCSPLPGEEIVGILTTGRGLTVHMRTCRNLEQLADQPDRWLPVAWSEAALKGELRGFICRLRFHVRNDTGTLAAVTSTIANQDANIIEITTEHRGADSMTIKCEMEIRTKEHLNKLIANLSGLKAMLRVEKIYGWN